MSEFFKRVEKKYILNEKQCNQFKNLISEYVVEDSHGKSKICNVYFDTPNYDLIRTSIEGPIYKDKVRVRSYNTPQNDTPIFLEIKRKSQGVVSKRRIQAPLIEVKQFIESGELNNINQYDSQVLKELKYYFNFYNLSPTAYVSYDRNAYYDKNDDTFRVTIDNNVTARDYDLALEKGSYGTQILDDGLYLLEAKTSDKLPLWFVQILSETNIVPGSFSKYGELYKKLILKANVA
jgi:SPX domain protein involved in polyphosphate accumulation